MASMKALECLVTIVEQGSLTKAAAVLHMSQPALSHQIAAIERELGTPVIERLPRGIRPTAAGLAAVAEARIALAAAERAVMAGRRVAAGAGGRIRIACAETMTAWVLVPVLRSWRRRFPDVELDLKEYTSADGMLEVLLAGGADITVGPPPTRTDEHIEMLGSEEIVVVASPEHRFSELDAVPLAELSAEPLVHYNPGNGNGCVARSVRGATRCRAAAADVAHGQPAHSGAAGRSRYGGGDRAFLRSYTATRGDDQVP